MKSIKKRACSILLSVCMTVSMMPISVFAKSEDAISPIPSDAVGKITEFDKLDTTEFTVNFGTEEEELDFPDTLTASVILENNQEPEQEEVEPIQAAEEKYIFDIEKWECADVYDGEEKGDYIFTPVIDLPEEIEISDSAKLPEIKVTVQEEEAEADEVVQAKGFGVQGTEISVMMLKYCKPNSEILLAIDDKDANTDPATPQTITAHISSTSDTTGFDVVLTETGDNAIQFQRMITLTDGDSNESEGKLKAVNGDTITLSYSTETATALVDGTAPTFAEGYPKQGEMAAAGSKHINVLVKLAEEDYDVTFAVGIVEKGSEQPSTESILNGSAEFSGVLYTYGGTIDASYELELECANHDNRLEDNTEYDAYVVLKDGAQNISEVKKIEVKTPPAGEWDISGFGSKYKSGDEVKFSIEDNVANTNPNAIETIIAHVKSTSDPIGIDVVLTELYADGNWANIDWFTGKFTFVNSASDESEGKLKVAEGDTITLSYKDKEKTAIIDDTAPTFAEGYPKQGEMGPTGSKNINIDIATAENDTAIGFSCIILQKGSAEPSAEDILGNNVDGVLANISVTDGSGTIVGVKKTINFGDDYDQLQYATVYDAYVVLSDSAGNLSEVKKVEVTTPPEYIPVELRGSGTTTLAIPDSRYRITGNATNQNIIIEGENSTVVLAGMSADSLVFKKSGKIVVEGQDNYISEKIEGYMPENGNDEGVLTIEGTGKLKTPYIKADELNVKGSAEIEVGAPEVIGNPCALDVKSLVISENANVTAIGGNGDGLTPPGIGVMVDGSINVSDNAVLTAIGGNYTDNNGDGAHGISAGYGLTTKNDGKITATGGNGENAGGNGISSGEVTADNGVVTATGGNGATGGTGIYTDNYIIAYKGAIKATGGNGATGGIGMSGHTIFIPSDGTGSLEGIGGAATTEDGVGGTGIYARRNLSTGESSEFARIKGVCGEYTKESANPPFGIYVYDAQIKGNAVVTAIGKGNGLGINVESDGLIFVYENAALVSTNGDGTRQNKANKNLYPYIEWYAGSFDEDFTNIHSVTVVNGITDKDTAMINEEVTITANQPEPGKVFGRWEFSTPVVIAPENSIYSSTLTFNMPAEDITATATYNDIAGHYITFNANGGTASGDGAMTTWEGKLTVMPIIDRDKYTFDGWYTAIDGGTKVDSDYIFTDDTTIYAHWTYKGGSSSNGSSSSSSSSPSVKVTKGTDGKPTTATAGITAKAVTGGGASVSVPSKTVTDAIAKAKAQAGTESGIAVKLNVSMPKNANALTTTLTQNSLKSLVDEGVKNLELSGSPVGVSFDSDALKAIGSAAKGDIKITMTPYAAEDRTAYDITISSDGKLISNFDGGAVTVSIPYAPKENESVSGLYAIYIDEDLNEIPVEGSYYDANSGSVVFTTGHFSVYAVGYKEPTKTFTDISGHWGKESIDYITKLGLIDGVTQTEFAPNAAMTRAALVTALGRLAKADTSEYMSSSFTDVSDDSTGAKYIEWAYKNQIIYGTGDGKFAPDRAITREEIAVIFANYAKVMSYELPKVNKAFVYADASEIGSYYKEAVDALQLSGIMTGDSSSRFNPKGNATRAEVSSMLYRYIG